MGVLGSVPAAQGKETWDITRNRHKAQGNVWIGSSLGARQSNSIRMRRFRTKALLLSELFGWQVAQTKPNQIKFDP